MIKNRKKKTEKKRSFLGSSRIYILTRPIHARHQSLVRNKLDLTCSTVFLIRFSLFMSQLRNGI